VLATVGDGLGQVDGPGALAVDTAGNLYVADSTADSYLIQRVQEYSPNGGP
jgi:hypothetical protein